MKKVFLAASIFASLLLLVIFSEGIYNKRDKSSNSTGEWKTIKRDLIYKVEIKKGDNRHVLKKDSGIWRLIEPVTDEADPQAVEDLLKGIEDIELDMLISSKKEKRGMFQVDDSGIEVISYDRDDKEMLSFVVGKSAPDFSHTYLRMSDSDKVYRAAGFNRYQFDKDTKMLRDKGILVFNKDNAQRITLRSKEKAILLQREGEDWFIKEPEEDKADNNSINDLLNTLSSFYAMDFEDKKDIKETSLDEPELEIIVESKDTELGRILTGKEEEDSRVYVKNGKKSQIYIVHNSHLNSLKKGVADFKVKENKDIP